MTPTRYRVTIDTRTTEPLILEYVDLVYAIDTKTAYERVGYTSKIETREIGDWRPLNENS